MEDCFGMGDLNKKLITFKDDKKTKLLYLDQNMWIYLGRIYYKKEENPNLSRILEKLQNLVQTDKLIIPINLTNIKEAYKRQNFESRERLFRFMIELSKGFSFIPYNGALDTEIRNIIRKLLDLPVTNIREYAIGVGIPFLMGAIPEVESEEIDSSILKEVNEKLLEKISTPDILLRIFLDPAMNFLPEETIQNFKTAAKRMEDIRKKHFKIKDKKLRNRVRIANFLVEMLIPRFIRICQEFHLNPLSIFPKNPNYDQIIEFFQKLPTMYSNFCLINGRDRIPNRPVEENDIFDIASLSFAIPYCDIVMRELQNLFLILD